MSPMDQERWQIRLRTQLFFDDLYERDDVPEDALDKIGEAYTQNLAYIFNCKAYGHCWEDDQCGLPEHQYCLFCRITKEQLS